MSRSRCVANPDRRSRNPDAAVSDAVDRAMDWSVGRTMWGAVRGDVDLAVHVGVYRAMDEAVSGAAQKEVRRDP